VLGHDRQMLGEIASAKDATMHLGMQGLDPAVEHLRETGVIGNVGDIQSGIAQQFGCTSGG
jgi:hypothetical protein